MAVDIIGANLLEIADFIFTILQALGIFIILWIAFNFANVFINKKRKSKLDEIHDELVEIKHLLARQK